MKQKTILEAAKVVEALDGAKTLRATIKGGKHELHLYAETEKDTMENEIEVSDNRLATSLLDVIVAELEARLKQLGVDQ